MPAIIAMTARPPTTPPAIAPAWFSEAGGGVGIIGGFDVDLGGVGIALVGGVVGDDDAGLNLDCCWSEHNDKDT